MFDLLSKLDKQAFLLCTDMGQRHGLKPLARHISKLGDGTSYLYLTAILMLVSDAGQAFFNLMLASFVIELPLYLALKNSFRRVRPCHSALGVVASFEPSDRFSLPSGHTAAAFVVASCVLLLFPQFMWLALAFACAIGLSRVILAVHFPLDIVAGMALGITSVMLAQNWLLN